MATTRLSSKGQIIISQRIREAHKWQPGLEFNVIDTDRGLLLTPRMPFKPILKKYVDVSIRKEQKIAQRYGKGIVKETIFEDLFSLI